jgi:hypothetical protein
MKLLSFSFLVGIMGIITSILSSICEDWEFPEYDLRLAYDTYGDASCS